MYLFAILVFFIVGGIFATLIRLEHLTPSQTIMTAQMYNITFTLHGSIMVFLFIIPGILASFGNFLVPLMIGAKDVIFPRLNLLSLDFLYRLNSLLNFFTCAS